MDKKVIKLFRRSIIGVFIICIAVFSCMTLIMSYNTEEKNEKISNVYMSEMNQQIQQKFQTVTSLQLEQVEGIIKRSEPGTKSYGRELLDELQMSAEIRNFTFLALYSQENGMEVIYGEDLTIVDFTDLAQSCKTYDEYISKMTETPAQLLNNIGLLIYGNKKKVNKLTGNMPLLR